MVVGGPGEVGGGPGRRSGPGEWVVWLGGPGGRGCREVVGDGEEGEEEGGARGSKRKKKVRKKSKGGGKLPLF